MSAPLRRRTSVPHVLVLVTLLAGCTLAGPAQSPPVPGADERTRDRAEELGRRTGEGPTVGLAGGTEPVRSFPEVRGLWVVRWTMTSPEQVRDMVERAHDAGFNTIIVQVRGRGDAFYRSDLEPRAETITGPGDFDPLALAIEEAHSRGMAVHAWLNTHLVWGPAGTPESPIHLVNARPDWLAVPRELGHELYDTDPFDERFFAALQRYAADRPGRVEGVYTSPSHPDVRDRIFDVWMDVVERYDVDGVHFDYIRFPSASFDYSRGALHRFRAWVAPRLSEEELRAADGRAESDPHALVDAHPEMWDRFRREQITSLVERIYGAVKERKPRLVVSAAVVADAEVAFESRFQDWRGWLERGLVDVVVPMAYTPDNERFHTLIRTARAAAPSRDRLWAGIGAYMNSVDGTIDKIDLARVEDVAGVVLFSYDWAAGEGQGDPSNPFLTRVGRQRFGR